jgi:hypothetical protein
MRRLKPIFILFLLLSSAVLTGQNPNPSPYCSGPYSTGNCLQGSTLTNNPSNFINDFIDFFRTTGGNTNIQNDSSGCNQLPNNFALYCNHYLQVTPGQTITCHLKSGITFAQGFAIFVDWDQNNTFQVPAERVAWTGVPPPNTWTTTSFVVPPNTPPGTYRLRVRCAFATPGNNTLLADNSVMVRQRIIIFMSDQFRRTRA